MGWVGAVFAAPASAIRALMTHDGRRAWALVLLAGGGFAMTAYASVALWLVRDHPPLVFSLGIAAHLSIILVLTGFAGLLVKRTIQARDGSRVLEITDEFDSSTAPLGKPPAAPATGDVK